MKKEILSVNANAEVLFMQIRGKSFTKGKRVVRLKIAIFIINAKVKRQPHMD